MSEGVKRFREPAAWLVVFATAVLMLVDLVRLGLEFRGPLGAEAFGAHGLTLLSPIHATVLLLAVASCAVLQPATPRSRPLTITALSVAGFGAATQFVFGMIGLIRSGQRAGALSALVDGVGYLGFTIFPVVAVVGLVKVLGGIRREAERQIEAAEATTQLPRTRLEAELRRAAEQADSADPDAADTVGPEPAWQRDEASGAAWRTAGAAASGARASGWGLPGERGGWMSEQASEQAGERPREALGRSAEPVARSAVGAEVEAEHATRIPRLPAPAEPPSRDWSAEPGATRRQSPRWKPIDRD